MKLYYHPASTTSRPLMLFAAENGIKMDMQVVDLFTGEHYQPPFAEGVNPNRQVPVLEDGDFRLTESATILKYLAVKTKSPLYPEGLKERARVNERIDWINTQLNRDLCYGLVYPQAFPHHKRPSDEHQKGTLSWAKERAGSRCSTTTSSARTNTCAATRSLSPTTTGRRSSRPAASSARTSVPTPTSSAGSAT
jgi:glutathione S-transferase